jgi:uncharacterized membrane protein
MKPKLQTSVALLGALLYPGLVMGLLTYGGEQFVVYLLIGLCITRLPSLKKGYVQASMALLPLGLAIWMLGADKLIIAKLYPALMNLLMFSLFFSSLFTSSSLVERIARLREPDLPTQAIKYTRKVTMIWCVFFVLNGAIALWTACCASLLTWSWYNGLIAYLLMGAVFIGEWSYRVYYVRPK